jgi:hypothetical protein
VSATDLTATALLESTAPLGRVRVVLRNCTGLSEIFCSCEEFVVADRWLHLRTSGAHLHLQLSNVTGVRFLEAGDADHPRSPAIWFYGRCGTPMLLLVLDQTRGNERVEQLATFLALRARFGPCLVLGATAHQTPAGWLH